MSKMPRHLLEEANRRIANLEELTNGKNYGKKFWAPSRNGIWHRCVCYTDILLPLCDFLHTPIAEEATQLKPKNVKFCKQPACKK
jgi:hypothetical protein